MAAARIEACLNIDSRNDYLQWPRWYHHCLSFGGEQNVTFERTLNDTAFVFESDAAHAQLENVHKPDMDVVHFETYPDLD